MNIASSMAMAEVFRVPRSEGKKSNNRTGETTQFPTMEYGRRTGTRFECIVCHRNSVSIADLHRHQTYRHSTEELSLCSIGLRDSLSNATFESGGPQPRSWLCNAFKCPDFYSYSAELLSDRNNNGNFDRSLPLNCVIAKEEVDEETPRPDPGCLNRSTGTDGKKRVSVFPSGILDLRKSTPMEIESQPGTLETPGIAMKIRMDGKKVQKKRKKEDKEKSSEKRKSSKKSKKRVKVEHSNVVEGNQECAHEQRNETEAQEQKETTEPAVAGKSINAREEALETQADCSTRKVPKSKSLLMRILLPMCGEGRKEDGINKVFEGVNCVQQGSLEEGDRAGIYNRFYVRDSRHEIKSSTEKLALNERMKQKSKSPKKTKVLKTSPRTRIRKTIPKNFPSQKAAKPRKSAMKLRTSTTTGTARDSDIRNLIIDLGGGQGEQEKITETPKPVGRGKAVPNRTLGKRKANSSTQKKNKNTEASSRTSVNENKRRKTAVKPRKRPGRVLQRPSDSDDESLIALREEALGGRPSESPVVGDEHLQQEHSTRQTKTTQEFRSTEEIHSNNAGENLEEYNFERFLAINKEFGNAEHQLVDKLKKFTIHMARDVPEVAHEICIDEPITDENRALCTTTHPLFTSNNTSDKMHFPHYPEDMDDKSILVYDPLTKSLVWTSFAVTDDILIKTENEDVDDTNEDKYPEYVDETATPGFDSAIADDNGVIANVANSNPSPARLSEKLDNVRPIYYGDQSKLLSIELENADFFIKNYPVRSKRPRTTPNRFVPS